MAAISAYILVQIILQLENNSGPLCINKCRHFLNREIFFVAHPLVRSAWVTHFVYFHACVIFSRYFLKAVFSRNEASMGAEFLEKTALLDIMNLFVHSPAQNQYFICV